MNASLFSRFQSSMSPESRKNKQLARAVFKNCVDASSKYKLKKYKKIDGYADIEVLYTRIGFFIASYLLNKSSNLSVDTEDLMIEGLAKGFDHTFSINSPVFYITEDLFKSLWNTRTPDKLEPINISLPGFLVMTPAIKDIFYSSDKKVVNYEKPGVLSISHIDNVFNIYKSPLLQPNCLINETLFNTRLVPQGEEPIRSIDYAFTDKTGCQPMIGGFDFNTDDNVTNKHLKFIYNLILYLQNYEEKITTDSSSTGFRVNRQKLKAKDIGQGYSPIRWLGKGYKIKYESGSTGSHKSPETHIRMGHWRKHAIGPRDKPDHKMIWIEPTLVNAK